MHIGLCRARWSCPPSMLYETACYIWLSNWSRLLQNPTTRMGMRKATVNRSVRCIRPWCTRRMPSLTVWLGTSTAYGLTDEDKKELVAAASAVKSHGPEAVAKDGRLKAALKKVGSMAGKALQEGLTSLSGWRSSSGSVHRPPENRPLDEHHRTGRAWELPCPRLVPE